MQPWLNLALLVASFVALWRAHLMLRRVHTLLRNNRALLATIQHQQRELDRERENFLELMDDFAHRR